MRILVTGAAGFIGSHLVDMLLAFGHKVIGLDNLVAGHKSNLSRAEAKFSDSFTFVQDDVCSVGHGCFDQIPIDAIFHLAASKKTVSINNPFLDLHTNACGTLELLEFALKKHVERFIHFSTGSVYGNSAVMDEKNSTYDPVSHYGVSKLAGERYALLYHNLYGLPVTILRPFHVYGPRQESAAFKGGVIGILCRAIVESKPFTIFGDGKQTRTFTYVQDVVRAAVWALDNPSAIGEVFNVSSGEVTSLLEVLEILKPQEILYGPETPGDIHDFRSVCNEKMRAFGFNYWFPLSDTLPAVLDWYKVHLS